MAFPIFARDTRGIDYYFLVDASGWVTTKQGLDSPPIQFEVYKDKGVNYLKVNDPTSSWNGRYLSVSNNGYLGIYSWSGATGWRLSGNKLVSAYNGQIVGIEKDGFYRAASGVPLSVAFGNSNNGEFYAGLS